MIFPLQITSPKITKQCHRIPWPVGTPNPPLVSARIITTHPIVIIGKTYTVYAQNRRRNPLVVNSVDYIIVLLLFYFFNKT